MIDRYLVFGSHTSLVAFGREAACHGHQQVPLMHPRNKEQSKIVR